MPTISKDAVEATAEYISELETERQSYLDEIAELQQKLDAALAQLQREKATE
jgi:hypothetical protein